MTKHILIVDDNEDNRQLLFFALMTGDYVIYQAGMRSEMEDVLAKVPCLDLALLDIELPDADGLELGKQLRERFPGIWLVMLSANDESNRLEKAREIGASAYVVKPFNLPQVLKFIRDMEAETISQTDEMQVL